MVAERVGDDRHRTELGEFVERAKSCRTSVEDDLQPVSQAGSVDVPARGVAVRRVWLVSTTCRHPTNWDTRAVSSNWSRTSLVIRVDVVDDLVAVAVDGKEVRIVANRPRAQPEQEPERLGGDPHNVTVEVESDETGRFQRALVPDVLTGSRPEVQVVLVRPVLPLAADGSTSARGNSSSLRSAPWTAKERP